MSDTINIGGITVSKFYLGGSSDVKIYLGTTKLYPHLQEPCFAVVADISQYSDRTYVDVYNQADYKWYKLNNLNQYEEYGVYGSGRTICSATSFIELTDIIAQSTTALTNHNITVTPAVGAFSKIRIDTTISATTGAYSWATFTPTPSGSEVLGINMNSIGSMNGLGSGKNYVTDANGSQTFAHWVDDNNTIVEIDIAALSNNQASELYLLFYQENCKPAAFSFYIGSSNCVTTYEGKLTIDDEALYRLPQGYTEVEYIESNGTQYINTNAYITNTDNFEVGYTISGKSHQWGYVHQNVANGAWVAVEESKAYFGRWNSRYWVDISNQITTGNNTIVYKSNSGITVNETFNAKTLSLTSTDNITTIPLHIFGWWDFYSGGVEMQQKTQRYKSFYLKVNGVLIRDLVPAKRNSDNKYGMYDLVTDTFYLSPNNVDFSGGEPIAPTKTYEYIYSGGSWVNLGEVSGSTITVKSPEYIEKDSSHNGKINLDYVWKTNSKMQFKFYSTNNGGGSMIGEDGMPDNNDCRMFFASTTAYFDWGSSRISWSSNGRTNTLYEYEYGNYYIKNMVTSASRTGSTISTSRTNPLYLGLGSSDRFRTYYLKFYDGDTLVKDFIPWTDMNGNYGLFDKVSLSVYNVVSGSLTGSSNVTDVEVGGDTEYPLEYPVKQDPPDNVTFTSMTEAESYECPWWGMTGIIDNTDYMFCETNTWLTKYSYQEVSGEYLCDSGNKYKKLQKYDRQLDGTMSATTTYVKGDLIEVHSSDCPQCTVNFCGIDANGNTVTVNNGTTTLTQSNWTSPYPVDGIVGNATTTIGMYCFRNISGTLTALTIGDTVTTIEHEAFMETSLLTTLTIPSSVTQIDFWAFTRCNGLNEVIFEGTTPPTFTNQNSGVFHDYCPPVIYVPDSAVSEYRAIDGSVWTNQSWSTNIIQPISNK